VRLLAAKTVADCFNIGTNMASTWRGGPARRLAEQKLHDDELVAAASLPRASGDSAYLEMLT